MASTCGHSGIPLGNSSCPAQQHEALTDFAPLQTKLIELWRTILKHAGPQIRNAVSYVQTTTKKLLSHPQVCTFPPLCWFLHHSCSLARAYLSWPCHAI